MAGLTLHNGKEALGTQENCTQTTESHPGRQGHALPTGLSTIIPSPIASLALTSMPSPEFCVRPARGCQKAGATLEAVHLQVTGPCHLWAAKPITVMEVKATVY